MKIHISATKQEMGRRAAAEGASFIREAVGRNGDAAIALATGTSQFELYHNLVRQEVNWGRVTVFHLDEYIGLPPDHPASFRRYLKERFEDRIPEALKKFHYIDAQREPGAECERLAVLIRAVAVDVAFVGIGENCHLAFNDPPADFQTTEPYITVNLDEACRRQQCNEGWFSTIDEVPRRAISMSVRQIVKSRAIVCTIPDKRKAEAVKMAFEGPVTPDAPASILREHANCEVFLDKDSASLLENRYAE
jgi:glucosamine-6-phosphate deaminase